jgi:hypothetical protein
MTNKQNMIAVSSTVKTFVKDCTADFGGPSKSKDFLAASEREILDGMVSYVEATRYQVREIEQPVMVEETNDKGETVMVDSEEVETVEIEVDVFAEAVNQVIADRMDSVRVNTAGAKLKNALSELETLKAQLAALTGATA